MKIKDSKSKHYTDYKNARNKWRFWKKHKHQFTIIALLAIIAHEENDRIHGKFSKEKKKIGNITITYKLWLNIVKMKRFLVKYRNY